MLITMDSCTFLMINNVKGTGCAHNIIFFYCDATVRRSEFKRLRLDERKGRYASQRTQIQSAWRSDFVNKVQL